MAVCATFMVKNLLPEPDGLITCMRFHGWYPWHVAHSAHGWREPFRSAMIG
jgi:hypothetical protein